MYSGAGAVPQSMKCLPCIYDTLLSTTELGYSENGGKLKVILGNIGRRPAWDPCARLKTAPIPCVVTISNREGFYAGTEGGIEVREAKGLVGLRHKGTAALLMGEGAELYAELTTVQGLKTTSPYSLLI